ncbi:MULTISPECIES: OmpA family protein [unclassified Caballeronia]|uniref:OmpA family protein n=1 Tax=unclassified Caballeronia TaxID=2646786 RepID=UPI002028E1B0|nr:MULTISPECIES: OmpA family protein [unclassified Caballeronia]
MLKALGTATAELPVSLRRRMPLVLVTGDALAALFDRQSGTNRLVFVGDGAIWLRVNRPQDLPQVALATRQWRDGQAPDGVVLCVAPAVHADSDALAQKLRLVRQARADASRIASARLPGYVAVYQHLTALEPEDANARWQWYGASAIAPIDAQQIESVVRTAETTTVRESPDPYHAARAAALASIVGWTQRVVFGTLTDPRHPAQPWPLYGAGWIDCGPASDASRPWERDVLSRTHVAPPVVAALSTPWPLPQPLIEAMPRHVRVSPRIAAIGHALALFALATAASFWGSGQHNAELITRVESDLNRFTAISAGHDSAHRDALKELVADRDELDRYARDGAPVRLGFGLYQGNRWLPSLNHAIASYQPPAPAPAVVTLDSMSLFDSGEAVLKPGSNRTLVGALEMIKAHPNKRILVAGYTDNVGDSASNLKLSLARATALRDWLIDASGIAATQFAIQGYGDTRPIASNDTDAGRAHNRRVEITLVPDNGATSAHTQ